MDQNLGANDSLNKKSSSSSLLPLVVTFSGPAIVAGASIAAAVAGLFLRPRSRKAARIVRSAAVAGVVLPWIYQFGLRPWLQYWGASSDEAHGTLPGDEIIAHPPYETTHAIAINVPADKVWPWLVQIGQGRGGLYSYDWLENMIGLDLHSADRIIPEFQNLQVGDTIRLAPEDPEVDMGLVVERMEPGRLLVLHANPFNPLNGRPVSPNNGDNEPYIDWTWAFILDKAGESATRLIVRVRGDYNTSPYLDPTIRALIEPPHFVMERKMMLGIKNRAERKTGD
ncbi:MAG TPA: hypothetical protein VGK02_03150 [Candidatus Aquicultor sp.]|jgi:hypothetical protein